MIFQTVPTCIVENREGNVSTETDAPVDPTEAPVAPTVAPVDPTEAPVAPTVAPVDPTAAPVSDDCGCHNNDPTSGSFKCGNDVYVCPNVAQICSKQDSQNSVYYKLTMEQCTAMKGVEIDTKCIPLPQYDLTATKDLSNRVCYGGNAFGTKRDASKCEACTGLETPDFEETTAPVGPTEAPVDPTEAPVDPTEAPVDPTEAPVDPTEAPVDPTEAPVDPTEAPVDPTEAPVAASTSGCECHHDDSRIGSWKCGKNIYVCPGFEDVGICGNQVKAQFTHYPLTAQQCEAMKAIKIDDKCIMLPEYGITDQKGLGLSNRVCYDSDHPYGTKTDTDDCGLDCSFRLPFTFAEPVRRRRWLF